MVPVFLTALSEITPLSAGPSLETKLILWTFMVAGFLFLLFWGIRAAMGKTSFTPPSPLLVPDEQPPALPSVAAETGEDASPYTPPGTLPAPPLPDPEPEGLARYFKVPTKYYRLFDLPLIGLVFLIYCGLTTASGGGDDSLPLEKKYTPEVLIASIFFQLLLMGMVCAFMVRRVKQSEWLGLRWKQWWLAFAIAPCTVFFVWAVLLVTALSGWNGWLEKTLGTESMQESVKLLQQAQDPMVIILMAIAAVIVAPIAEEVVFRGYLYPAAKRFCGPFGAMIFSSLVFAAAHGSAVALLPLFILAMLLCMIYEFTGSIWANIAVHLLFNGATVAIQLMARYGIVDMSPPP